MHIGVSWGPELESNVHNGRPTDRRRLRMAYVTLPLPRRYAATITPQTLQNACQLVGNSLRNTLMKGSCRYLS